MKQCNNYSASVDVSEDTIRKSMPEVLDILLTDHTNSTETTKKNIIWANENYRNFDKQLYNAKSQITKNLITRNNGYIIMPRALKDKILKRERTKKKAEVFTPLWIIKKQNDEVEKQLQINSLEEYIKVKWLEVACGEGPYMTSRYDVTTGKYVETKNREGFVDRKLKKITEKIDDKIEYERLAVEVYKSSYGFEWNGDSLLIARENLLYTFMDYYYEKWMEKPRIKLIKQIAEIISYNVFQMNGIPQDTGYPLKQKGKYYIFPLSDEEDECVNTQLSFDLFSDNNILFEEKTKTKGGIRVKIKNWDTNKLVYFDEGV